MFEARRTAIALATAYIDGNAEGVELLLSEAGELPEVVRATAGLAGSLLAAYPPEQRARIVQALTVASVTEERQALGDLAGESAADADPSEIPDDHGDV